jgi:hypothetical protein
MFSAPFVPLRAFAQSMDYETPPEHRDMIYLDMKDWWDLNDPRMIPHPADGEPHWYEGACCSDSDCRGFSAELVRELADGSVVLTLPPVRDTFPGMDIVFDKSVIRDRPHRARTDPYWHFCFTIGVEIVELGVQYHAFTVCAYRPSPSV